MPERAPAHLFPRFTIPALALGLALSGCSGGSSARVTYADSAGGASTETARVAGGEGAAPTSASTGGATSSGARPRRDASSVAPAAPTGDYMGGAAEAEAADMPAPPPSVARRVPAPGDGGDSAGAPAPEIDVDVEVTVRVDDVAPEPTPQPQQVAPQARILTAAAVGDTDRRGNYLQYLGRHPYEASRVGVDMSRRVRFRVVDGQQRPVRGAVLQLSGQQGSVEGRTQADGYWDYFPGVLGDVGSSATATISAPGAQARVNVQLPMAGDGRDVTIELRDARARSPRRLDLAFLIDVTGSMEDELRYVNAEVSDIVARVRAAAPEVAIRVGATFYRDRHDSRPLEEIRFTNDVQAFARAMRSVRASGGGDYPEDLHSGLAAAMSRLSWSNDPDTVRVLVVIADAPPQRYATQFGHIQAMQLASRNGVRVLPVAASGADREVEFLFRAMATVTGAPYVYLTDESGVGNPHMEADTDRVAVEYFNDLLTRLVIGDVRGAGMHELVR